MTGYNIAQFLHVLAAATWFGSGVAFTVLLSRLRAAGDATAMRAVASQLEVVGKRLFGPAAGATALFGVITVLLSRGTVKFNDLWVIIGIAGVVASGIFAGVVVGPFDKRLASLEADAAADQGALDALRRRSVTLGLVDLALIAIVMWAMVAKPGA